MHKLGILGGMGPEATALFFERVIANTRAEGDEGHIPSVILNDTLIPDRTRALLGEGPSPVGALQKDVDTLARLGVTVLATPCNTAHAFLEELSIPEGMQFVNMVTATLDACSADLPLCVLGTTGLAKAGVYERFDRALHRFIPLTDAEQDDVMQAILLVKASRHAEALSRLVRAAKSVNARVTDAFFLLSCTELSVLREEFGNQFSYLDALEVLARECVKACGYPIKEDL